ncbi:hypothetical protein GCM10011376_27950 [Nocardioides flavus (ex Wang et al. 2016)]|uniref:Uncharacterized protein n=1 Tax=Nocardioides flavus (ex Wang et al. 2016) TaxID=2058780 RepID=A0ABQ3HKH6_9ACTN|nr:hypothetical protein [Nocardioides flavus (ex Wang et al. 2016)]GHE18185.1 hypothetical protein GCM10011376_27950 [Nocardioides flavus (ex Wang et al. 2016)]
MTGTGGGAGFACRIYGLDVISDIDLHARRPLSATRHDVTVRLGETIPATQEVPEGEVMAQWTTAGDLTARFVRRDDGSHLLRFEGTCDVVIPATLDRITVNMVDGVPDAMAGVLVGGTVLSWLLILRGELVLHASAVDVGGRALGFVGASGMGKSTMATLMCRDGGLLVTDDVLGVTRDATGVHRCALGATELRLRQAASGLVEDFAEGGSHRDTADQRRALTVPAATADDLPVTALLVPRPRRDSTMLTLTRVAPAAATLCLLGLPRIPGIRDHDVLAGQLLQTSDLAERVPVLVADVPWGPPFEPDLAARLLAELDGVLAPRSQTEDIDRDLGARC